MEQAGRGRGGDAVESVIRGGPGAQVPSPWGLSVSGKEGPADGLRLTGPPREQAVDANGRAVGASGPLALGLSRLASFPVAAPRSTPVAALWTRSAHAGGVHLHRGPETSILLVCR